MKNLPLISLAVVAAASACSVSRPEMSKSSLKDVPNSPKNAQISPADGTYALQSRQSNQCLDVPRANFTAEVKLREFACNGTAAQVFRLTHVDGAIHLQPSQGDLVLTPSSPQDSGYPFILKTKDPASTPNLDLSQWKLIPFELGAQPVHVDIVEKADVYFLGNDNQREKSFEKDINVQGQNYKSATLHLQLSCPADHCDAWDRVGSFGVVDSATGTYIEILRFMTPYGIGGQWDLDVTDLLPLFNGRNTYKLSIDTWVGPGNDAGNGWLVDIGLDYTPGFRSFRAKTITPLLSSDNIPYGNPSRPTQRSKTVPQIAPGESAKLFTLITGHGQGNDENCAEFCPKVHTIKIGDQIFSKTIWRDDCEATVDHTQRGYYQFSRAGWCPGDIVRPWIETVSSASDKDSKLSTQYDVEAYTNNATSYDGNAHTDPYYLVSSYLIYGETY